MTDDGCVLNVKVVAMRCHFKKHGICWCKGEGVIVFWVFIDFR